MERSSSSSSSEDYTWNDRCVVQMYMTVAGSNSSSMPGKEPLPSRLTCGDQFHDEKNWISFVHDGQPHYIYSVEPHIVMKVDDFDGTCHQAYNTSNPFLHDLNNRISVRGSATAIRYTDETFLALLHTTDTTSLETYTTRAYEFEARPPFRVVRISKPLELQFSAKAFASSLTEMNDKIFVGYSVEDRYSRLFVMSRNYLDKQFQDKCDTAINTVISNTSHTCAEKSVAYMLGPKMMPPRRAVNYVGNEFTECRSMVSNDCSVKTILKTKPRDIDSCSSAMAHRVAGFTCSSRVKWLVSTDNMDIQTAMHFIANEFKDCRPMLTMGCSPNDFKWPDDPGEW